jgi:hypothetical protein
VTPAAPDGGDAGPDGAPLRVSTLELFFVLYQRVNRNIARVAPFNLAAALWWP